MRSSVVTRFSCSDLLTRHAHKITLTLAIFVIPSATLAIFDQ
jgi:hypothetical protein